MFRNSLIMPKLFQLTRKSPMKKKQTEKFGKTIYLASLLVLVSGLSISFSVWMNGRQSTRTAIHAMDESKSEQTFERLTNAPFSGYQSNLIHPFEDPIKKSALNLDALPSYPQVTLVGNYARRDNRHWSQKTEEQPTSSGYRSDRYGQPVYRQQRDPILKRSGPFSINRGNQQVGFLEENDRRRSPFRIASRQDNGQPSFYGGKPQSTPYQQGQYEMLPSGGYENEGYGQNGYGPRGGGYYHRTNHNQGPTEYRLAIDDAVRERNGGRTWKSARPRPWDSGAYTEYIGPYRTPHTYGDYRLRVNDELRFTYLRTHVPVSSYRLAVGDEIEIGPSEPIEGSSIKSTRAKISPEGFVYLPTLNGIRAEGLTIEQLRKNVEDKFRIAQSLQDDVEKISVTFTVRPIEVGIRLKELIRTVDSTAGQGGTFVTQRVHPDGQIRLQGIPQGTKINAIGFTLDELEREINLQYAAVIPGVSVKVALDTRATRSIFVLGEVGQAGQIEINRPVTVMSAIAMAGNFNQGADLKNVVIFRRDQNWRLIATKVDLSKVLFRGDDPSPDDIWLRDSDIIVVPKTRIQRISELVDLYFTRTIYAIVPNQGFSFNFDNNSEL